MHHETPQHHHHMFKKISSFCYQTLRQKSNPSQNMYVVGMVMSMHMRTSRKDSAYIMYNIFLGSTLKHNREKREWIIV